MNRTTKNTNNNQARIKGASNLRVSIVGASGYVGGEALRLLLQHPQVEVVQATSESNLGKFVSQLHPNLRRITDLKFSSIEDLEEVDVLFLALPHGISSEKMDYFMTKAERIIDKGSDFRLDSAQDYELWYGHEHVKQDLVGRFVYGIPEIHREEIKDSKYVAAAGCNATASILALNPLAREGLIDHVVLDVKAGSSQSGYKPSPASNYSERRDVLRSYKPTGHRHLAEIRQEIGLGEEVTMSVTSVSNIRGILVTAHVFTREPLQDKDLWKIYRKYYGDEPFVRIVKERQGLYRYPEPKILAGTNYCDIGFEVASPSTTNQQESDQSNTTNQQSSTQSNKNISRIVVLAAIDNLMKGAAGQAVQCMNIMLGFDETLGLEFPGLHPV